MREANHILYLVYVLFLPVILSPFFYNSTSLLFWGSIFSPLCVILVVLSIMWPHIFHCRSKHRSQKGRSECVHHFPGHCDWNLSCSANDPWRANQNFFSKWLQMLGEKRFISLLLLAIGMMQVWWCWLLSLLSHGGRTQRWRGRKKPQWHCIYLGHSLFLLDCPFPESISTAWINLAWVELLLFASRLKL